MKYRAELIIWAYSNEGESLGCVYESESTPIMQGHENPRLLSETAWKEIEETAKALEAVEKAPRLHWGINDFRNDPVPGTRSRTEKNAIYFFLRKKRIKWWWLQERFGYYVVGPCAPTEEEFYTMHEKSSVANPHGDYCRCAECEGH